MIRLSLIVPVYNVERYVERCIRSLEQQDIPREDYEIIVVDDGSQDRSISLVEQLCREFSNLVLVHKPNGGLSSARNFGIPHARGKYIWFVDSDDYVESRVLKDLLDQADALDLDLLAFNYCDIWPDKSPAGFNPSRQPVGKVISGETYIRDYPVGISAWFFLVRRELLPRHAVRFTEGIIHEDYEFTLHLYKYVRRMTFRDVRVYNYFHREGSIPTTRGYQQVLKSIRSWQKIVEIESARYTSDSSYDQAARQWVDTHKFFSINRLFFGRIPLSLKQEEYRRLCRLGAFRIGRTHLNLERRLRCRLLCCPWFYTTFMRCFTSTQA